MTDLSSLFGPIDIYLFDQILRGRIAPGMTVFDAGCGQGRNLVFLLQEGYEVFAVDPSPSSIEAARALARELAPRLPASNFRAEAVESNSFADGCADVVLSSAVLHFARDEEHFRAMLEGTWVWNGSGTGSVLKSCSIFAMARPLWLEFPERSDRGQSCKMVLLSQAPALSSQSLRTNREVPSATTDPIPTSRSGGAAIEGFQAG